MDKPTEVNILGVKVNKVDLDLATKIAEEMIKRNKKYYIVTPNVEFIMAAQKDPWFKECLNNADLAIPDSSHFSWAVNISHLKGILKLFYLPFVILPPNIIPGEHIPVTTGIDLLYSICKEADKKGFTIGLIGGEEGVAESAAECLMKEFKNIKIIYANSGPVVNADGEVDSINKKSNNIPNIPMLDILFVGFGQLKQEKWIVKNLDKLSILVAIGVGGALDFVSGRVIRAPLWIRKLGLEWFFRLTIQPWRIKRQLTILSFVEKMLSS